MVIRIDISKQGYDTFFKPWQINMINYLHHIHPKGANSRKVYESIHPNTGISRASVINFLNMCVEDGILTYVETKGKGGHHRVYALPTGIDGLTVHLAESTIKHLLAEFPEETLKVITDLK